MTADSLLEPIPVASVHALDEEETQQVSGDLIRPPSLLMQALISPQSMKAPPLTAAAKLRSPATTREKQRRVQYNSLGVKAPVSKDSQKRMQHAKAQKHSVILNRLEQNKYTTQLDRKNDLERQQEGTRRKRMEQAHCQIFPDQLLKGKQVLLAVHKSQEEPATTTRR